MNRRKLLYLTVAWLVCCCVSGCRQAAEPKNEITLATTTSTQDTGLLDVLVPKFREKTGIDVRVVAVGSGQAMELGRRGDAEVLLTHAPAAEEKFIADGFGTDRRPLMHNDFVLLGPKADPAEVKGLTSIAESFARLAETQVQFVSRGDESGTHTKEREIWKRANLEPQGEWYIRAGVGMANALRMAQERQAYVLSDRGTFLSLKNELELEVLSEREPVLENHYSIMTVSRDKHSHVNTDGATKFVDFLTEPATKEVIAEFGVEKYGEPLFYPAKSPAGAR
jgi:tungstate transport system substrate-binding protein